MPYNPLLYEIVESNGEKRVVFREKPNLMRLLNAVHMEFPGVRFELIKISSSKKDGKVVLYHGEPKRLFG